MSFAVTPRALFEAVGLVPCGPVPWGEKVPETGPGVYVVARVASAGELGERVEAEDALKAGHGSKHARWLQDQPVVYIGKATCLRMRVRQFYRHRYGERRPHRGGQDVLLLTSPLWVYWAAMAEPRTAERAMLQAFREKVGARPFGNRRD
jgi:hypothetical protein